MRHTGSHGNTASLIGLIPNQHRPRCACILCRERRGSDVPVPASTQFHQPGISHRGPGRSHAYKRTGAVNLKCSQCGIAALADAGQVRRTAQGMLAWHQTQPGSQFAATAESSGVADRGCQGRCGERPHSGYCFEKLTGRIRTVDRADTAFKPSDLVAQFAQVFDEHLDYPPERLTVVIVRSGKGRHGSSPGQRVHDASDSMVCCACVLSGTKRMCGRVIASQIASGSAASVLLLLT
ncbi:hypothetical protein LMG29542_08720 [Paraburkholderia humisilvae]|uniref:Uncharacterized protein n=1 Tax=Paraburkholderia humisilvae TaxID=627669 RepID=A0A6J5F8W8_9BURK|nr:hypothetical protein LMG29542_08720 [Paraburkholderia humisilvae]